MWPLRSGKDSVRSGLTVSGGNGKYCAILANDQHAVGGTWRGLRHYEAKSRIDRDLTVCAIDIVDGAAGAGPGVTLP
jgi:hypothetical protein